MMVEFCMRKRGMGDEDENDMENTSGPAKSGVQLSGIGIEDLLLVSLPGGSRLGHTLFGMVNWLADEILLSPSLSWWFSPCALSSLILVLNSTITKDHEVKSSLYISPRHDHYLILCTVCIKYTIIPRSTVSCSQPVYHSQAVSHLPVDDVVLNSLRSHNDKPTNE